MKSLPLSLFLSFLMLSASAQDTFSIVAVDSATGEVGSAGASCLDETQIAGGVLIISDVLPGKGAIHTQSYWLSQNQQNARVRMEGGDSPQEIIAWLSMNDAQGNPAIRQYGIVDFDSQGSPRAAAFTGADCLDYKNHILGPDYSIQGNILLGSQILDSMEARFLRTKGTLSDKLMAALQGANVPGADSRCMTEGVSSLSAFLRVAKPHDADNNLWLDLQVPKTPFGHEPIDSLQILYDQWRATSGISEDRNRLMKFTIADNGNFYIIKSPCYNNLNLANIRVYDLAGKLIYHSEAFGSAFLISKSYLKEGIYLIRLYNEKGDLAVGKLVNMR